MDRVSSTLARGQASFSSSWAAPADEGDEPPEAPVMRMVSPWRRVVLKSDMVRTAA